MWIFYAFLSVIFAALVAIFGKLGLKNIDSTLATIYSSNNHGNIFIFGKFRVG